MNKRTQPMFVLWQLIRFFQLILVQYKCYCDLHLAHFIEHRINNDSDIVTRKYYCPLLYKPIDVHWISFLTKIQINYA